MLAELGLTVAVATTGVGTLPPPQPRANATREAVRIGVPVLTDLVLTEYALANDPRVAEGNPFVERRAIRWGYAALSTAASAWAIAEMERRGHRRGAGAVRGGVLGQRLMVVGMNAWIIKGGSVEGKQAIVGMAVGAGVGAVVGWALAR